MVAASNGDIAVTTGLSPSDLVGTLREMRVVEITGGKSAMISRIKDGKIILEDTPIIRDGKTVTGVDVYGKNGELIQVAGPAKGSNPDRLAQTLRAFEHLKDEAKIKNTTAQAYFERGDSEKFERLIAEARKILGKENVFILP